jgi:hypothetical protein
MTTSQFDMGWLIGAMVLLLVVAWFGWVEYHAYLLKTRVTNKNGMLRFAAHDWSVEVDRSTQQMRVQARHGYFSRKPLVPAEGQAPEQQAAHEGGGAPTDVTLPAPGLRMAIRPGEGAGMCVVEFQASDQLGFAAEGKTGGESYLLALERVPEPVAVSFNQFAGQLRVWVEKQERRLATQMREKLAAQEQEAKDKEKAEKAASKTQVPKDQLSPEAQVAQWRTAAGFSGTSSEIGLTESGGIAWYVDLDMTGRITLHSNNRTVHTTLQGAKVVALGGELEVSVRDDFWSAEEPELRSFRILKGLPPDERRAWKERLEILRDELRTAAGLQK